MNSIEAVDELERRGPAATRIGQRPAVPAPAEVMRLYKKEANRYVLQHEGDFQTVMKKAETLYQANIDVLVNEKANPLHVHVKSNLHNDVDVGREVQPAEKDGVYEQGKGEILLESFYQKLPLVDKAQPERAAVDERKPLFRPPAVETVPPDAQKPGKPGVDLDKTAAMLADKDAERIDGAAAIGKPILKRTGYELPAHVASAYSIEGGLFRDKDSYKVRFEDHGKKLSTSLEDRTVIAHMVDVAEAKQWDHIELTGTQSFRQMAWLEAESRGIRTKGYDPSPQDRQQLAQAKKVRGVTIETGADKAKNSIVVNTEHQLDVNDQSTERFSSEQPTTDRTNSDKKLAIEQPAADRMNSDKKVEPAQPAGTANSSGEKGGPIIGRLVAHGRDHFNHDPDEKVSYFVTLRTPAGERKIWGKDLERSMAGGEFKPGDTISLERKGWEPVTVDANVRDDAGKVVGKEEIEAQRYVWDVQPAGLVVMRTLSDDERVRYEAAYKVLDQATAKYPTDTRREILNRFADGVEKGDMDLPAPQVVQRSIERTPEPAIEPEPELDRG